MKISDKIVRQVREIAENHEIEKVVLFGSRARGDNSSRSDIDLAIYLSNNSAREGIVANEIEEIDTLLKIDLVFITNDSDPELLRNIEKEGVVLYERFGQEISQLQ